MPAVIDVESPMCDKESAGHRKGMMQVIWTQREMLPATRNSSSYILGVVGRLLKYVPRWCML